MMDNTYWIGNKGKGILVISHCKNPVLTSNGIKSSPVWSYQSSNTAVAF